MTLRAGGIAIAFGVLLTACDQATEIGSGEVERTALQDKLCYFYPIVRVGSSEPFYQIREQELSIVENASVTEQLQKYGIPHSLRSDGLYVSCVAMGDIEYMYNIASKAGVN